MLEYIKLFYVKIRAIVYVATCVKTLSIKGSLEPNLFVTLCVVLSDREKWNNHSSTETHFTTTVFVRGVFFFLGNMYFLFLTGCLVC